MTWVFDSLYTFHQLLVSICLRYCPRTHVVVLSRAAVTTAVLLGVFHGAYNRHCECKSLWLRRDEFHWNVIDIYANLSRVMRQKDSIVLYKVENEIRSWQGFSAHPSQFVWVHFSLCLFLLFLTINYDYRPVIADVLLENQAAIVRWFSLSTRI